MGKALAIVCIIAMLIGYDQWRYHTAYAAGEKSTELFYQQRIAERNHEADTRLAEAQEEAVRATDKYLSALSNELTKQGELDETKRRLRLAKRDNSGNDGRCDKPDDSIYRMYNSAASADDLQASDHFQTPDAEGDGLEAVQASVREAISAKLHANALIDVLVAAETNGCVRVTD